MKIKSIAIGLTSHCQINCPYCSWGINKIPLNKREFYSWEYLEHIAKFVKGIPVVYIICGEPTMHPKFAEWSPLFRDLFKPSQQLILWTNGYGNKLFPEAFQYYDWIIMTKMTENTFPNSPNNSEEIQFLFDYYKDKTKNPERLYRKNGDQFSLQGEGIPLITMGEVDHIGSLGIQGTESCGRDLKGSNMVAYLDGKIYPCCGEMHMKEAVGIEPDENWEEKIFDISVPCNKCFFAK